MYNFGGSLQKVYLTFTGCKKGVFNRENVESVENLPVFCLLELKKVENSVENVENGLGKPFAGFIFTGDNLRLTVRRIVKFLG